MIIIYVVRKSKGNLKAYELDPLTYYKIQKIDLHTNKQ